MLMLKTMYCLLLLSRRIEPVELGGYRLRSARQPASTGKL